MTGWLQSPARVIRPPGVAYEVIVARGRLIEKGGRQALASATVEEPGGTLAQASSRCMIIDVPGALPDPPEGGVPWPEYSGPHPFQRPPDGSTLPQELWDSRDGIDVLRGWAAGSLPRSPLATLFDIQLAHVEPGSVTCTVPASPWLSGMSGLFYGGALAILADYAMHGAVQSQLSAGTAWATLDVKLRFLRPTGPDRTSVAARARIVHQGRRVAVAAAEISGPDGRLDLLADASMMVLPHRPWSDLAAVTDESAEIGLRPFDG